MLPQWEVNTGFDNKVMLPQKLTSTNECTNTSMTVDSRIEASPRIASQCSCLECDSIECFAIRNSNLPCTCEACKDKKKCTSFPKSQNTETDNTDNCIRIIRQDVIEHEETDSTNEHIKGKDAESYVTEDTKYIYKDMLLITDKINLNQEKPHEKSIKRSYSVTINYSRNEEKIEYDNPAAKLSAEIMNFPYSEFKESVSTHRTPSSMNTAKLAKLDILTKLKEIYKACSCKVCECVTGRPCFSRKDENKKEICICIDSDYCNQQIPSQPKELTHPGCACYSCDRKNCKGVVKETTQPSSCDCEPCDCVNYTKSFTKPCECEPCQCLECTQSPFPPRSIIVAPVQENFQQNLCQCEPCECVHCTQNYGAMASSLMHEASTGMVTQRDCHCETCLNNACQIEGADCRCDIQSKIVRKPIDRHNREYDLRRALIGEKSYGSINSNKSNKHDPIVMFTLSNMLTNTVFNKAKDRCQCKVCECIVCKDMERYREQYESLPKRPYKKCSKLPTNTTSIFKCQSSECYICNNDQAAPNFISNKDRCVCDNCDCISCEGNCSKIHAPYVHHNKNFSETKSNIVMFGENCDDVSKDVSEEILFPLKKGKLLTPSMFEDNLLPHSRSFPSHTSLRNFKKEKQCKSILRVNVAQNNKNILSSNNQPIPHTELLYKYINILDKQSSNPLNQKFLISCNDPLMTAVTENLSGSVKNKLNSNNRIDIKRSSLTCRLSDSKEQTSVSDDALKINFRKTGLDIIKKNLSLTSKWPLTGMDKSSEGKILDLLNISPKCSSDGIRAKIQNFENSVSQLQEDISRHLKTLGEIRLKDQLLNDKLSPMIYESEGYLNKINSEISFYDKIIPDKEVQSVNINILKNPKPIKSVVFRDQQDKLIKQNKETKSEVFNRESLIKNIKGIDILDTKTLDNGDNKDYKMYTRLIKRTLANIMLNKLRKQVTRSTKLKQISHKNRDKRNSLKEKFRHSKNKLTLSLLNHKSTSVSLEKFVFLELEKLNDKHKCVNAECDHIQKKIGSCYEKEYLSLGSVMGENIYLSYPQTTKNIGVGTLPVTDFNKKRAVNSVSLQTTENRGFRALTNLQLEVNELLNMPLFQVSPTNRLNPSDMDSRCLGIQPKSKLDFQLNYFCNVSSQTEGTKIVDKETSCNFELSKELLNKDIHTLIDFLLMRTICRSEFTGPNCYISREGCNMSKINSEKTSFDGLKVSFTGLRKVSDHSVLVRWSIPRNVMEVQGYELQVDGRAVQKILSPSRCMAVLTCLPNCDKLLLTIRTLTTTRPASGHFPTCTTVYCPRERQTNRNSLYFDD